MKALLNPESIAIIGASENPEKIGSLILKGLLRYGRPIYPVHPKAQNLMGHCTVCDINRLPQGIDLAIIATGAIRSVEAAEACARRGVKNLIIVAGGFGEIGDQGRTLENRLKEIPKQYNTRILGPNTLGIFHPPENLDTLFVEHGDKSLAAGGGTAFVSQSGSVGVEALGLAGNTGFGLRGFVGLGNKCDLDEVDFLIHYASDEKTTCIAFYLETLTRARDFLAHAKAASKKKPVVVLKAGRTHTGAFAASSHTGRLAGSDRVVSGAFRQHGIQRVYDDEALCDAAKALAALPASPGNRVAILSPAGGYGVMGADHVESSDMGIPLKMAHLDKKTTERIIESTFVFASGTNPVDVTASATDTMMAAALKALISDPGVDMIICTAFFAPPGITEGLIDEIASVVHSSKKPVILFTQYGPFTDDYLLKFHQKGIVGFPSIARAVRAARFIYERSLIKKMLDNEQSNHGDNHDS